MVKKWYKLLLSAVGFAMLILDTKTALRGASEGIELCLYTVIPSLFPFIFLSAILIKELTGKDIRVFHSLGRFLRMPYGSEGFLLVGLLGGYPTGAACIANGYHSGQIKKEQAERLLGFCCNAGPSFIFGVASSLFSGFIPWVLWGIHILSALLTALLLPHADGEPVKIRTHAKTTISEALAHSVRTMGLICGWVILFRILIAFCVRWFLYLLPEVVQFTIFGILELSNGCCSLTQIDSIALRFLLFSVFLSFGGVCVLLQTETVTHPLSLRWYLVGKLLQCLYSLTISVSLIPLLFPSETIISSYAVFLLPISILVTVIMRTKPKKIVAFPIQVLYNGEN